MSLEELRTGKQEVGVCEPHIIRGQCHFLGLNLMLPLALKEKNHLSNWRNEELQPAGIEP